MQYAGFNPWGKVFSAGQKIAQPAQKTTAPPDEFPLTKNKKTTKKTPCHKPFGQHFWVGNTRFVSGMALHLLNNYCGCG